ncbi:hypothetical protein GGQ99_004789 [Aminobacter niigataensis]|uniref:Rho termination factor, N-terminal domain n=1 Tax=Aminobacter niigataensis TaxID=83265 RepID=A0ABR6L8D7_9HYPH|nr:hypothetical protein [Aminobacter niigataensis]MBB4653005.1 hypothetical protein [Aminobacter niigataensis]
MKGKVIKAFPFAFDGISIQHLPVNTDFPPVGYAVSQRTFDGMVDAGFVERGAADELPAEEALNREIIAAFDRQLSAASDQDLKDIIARSGQPYSGNLVHAHLVLAAKRQMLAEMQGVEPVFGIDPTSGVTEQPLSKPGEATPPSAAAAVQEQLDQQDAGKTTGENKATNQFGDPLPGAAPRPTVDLDGLKKDELEKLAAERGVDISAAKTKPEILAALKAAQA